MQEIRRDDGELCGFVRRTDDGWQALTVFHAVLRETDDEASAEACVRADALASLQGHWSYRPAHDDDWQTALVQEARPGAVRLALGYYALPGVPTVTVTAADLDAGVGLVPGLPLGAGPAD